MRMLGILASVVALSACGANNQAGTAQKSAISAEDATAFSSQLPTVAIVRVPVDSNGQEMHDKAEMRTTNETSISDTSISSIFDTATTAVATVDELDSDSSTEAFGWRRCCRKAARRACRQAACTTPSYSYNYSESESYTSSGYGPGYNWNMYSPTYYYGGYYYNWNYAQTYSQPGNYNYYRYNRNFRESYNGYGWAN